MPADEMKSDMLKNMLRAGLLAGVFAAVGAAMVAITYQETRDEIAENQRQVLVDTLNQLIPAEQYDNDILADSITVRDPDMFGSDEPILVYRARKDGKPVAALLTPIAPDGYSGDIHLLVGIHYSGRLAGVRILAHKETPGLGDIVEKSKSDWLDQFDGASLGKPSLDEWNVKRDGGEFDQVTGATITPRAIVRTVKNTLLYYNGHRETIFAAATDADNATEGN